MMQSSRPVNRDVSAASDKFSGGGERSSGVLTAVGVHVGEDGAVVADVEAGEEGVEVADVVRGDPAEERR
jgi:hypothetical protein